MRGRPTYFVAPWDLDRRLPCVPPDPDAGSVVLVESVAKSRALPYHRKKLVFVLSAMHHFADALRRDGFHVTVIHAPTYVDGIARHIAERGASEVIAMQPREWGLSRALARADAEGRFGVPLTLHDDGGERGHFLLTRAEAAAWIEGRKRVRLADFYRFMRKKTGWLMDGGEPLGGRWSFDADNREHARGHSPPAIGGHPPDATTLAQIQRVAGWTGHWGHLDGFDWAVTRADALADLDAFFRDRAASFGRFQDAMIDGEPFLWHSLISAAINVSLLHPREVCERIVAEHDAGRIPLAAAEGLLRQIIGWRELVRAVYWRRMPGLRHANLLSSSRPLPRLYWEPETTRMQCLRDAVTQVQQTGYAHHIQRLMVLGNFALLAGIDPRALSLWFWAAFVDAYEWVELPNVIGMAMYADDTFTTKPYAASGRYIDKMSDYCGSCPYDVRQRHGPDACPYNPLFWAFMHRHRDRLQGNPRLQMLYRTWDRLDADERDATLVTAERLIARLPPPAEAWHFADDDG